MRIFAWLLAAERALSISELITAVRLREEDSDAKYPIRMDLYDAQMILNLCCNFVALDHNSGQVSFVHASVLEYIKLLPEYSVSMSNFTVAKRCLELFIFDDEGTDDAMNIDGGESDSGDDSNGVGYFREYAICHWEHHFLKTTDATVKPELDAILKQFVSEKEAMAFTQWLEDVKVLAKSRRPRASHLKEVNATLNDFGSPIFMACVYGIPTIFEQIEFEAVSARTTVDYNAKNGHGASALYISARYGRTDTLRFLLDRGAKVDEPGGFFGNPLQAAAFHGHQEVVRILVEERADLFAAGKFTSALDAAMNGGNEQVIRLLLGPSNITDTAELEKVLLKASYDGHYEVVCHLLSVLGLAREPKDCSGTDNARLHGTLQMALFQCRARIGKRMLKDVTNINTETGHFGNALQAAAFGGHISMVTMVLDRQASVNSRGRYGTALRAASLRGHDAVVRLLVGNGASIHGLNADAIQAAAFHGHLSTVKVLLDSDLYNTHRYSYELLPAVQAACSRGHMDVAKLFLQIYGAGAAFTAFDTAMQAGQEVIMRLALEYEPRLKNSELPDGSEGLCSAGGSLSLLPRSPSSDAQLHYLRRVSDANRRHALRARRHKDDSLENSSSSQDEACQSDGPGGPCPKLCARFEGRLPWLEPDKEDSLGRAVSSDELKLHSDIGQGNGRFLRLAARYGFVDIIQHLLDQRLDMNTTGNESGPLSGQSTPIEVAAAAGQSQVVQLFLSQGAKVGKALSYAVRNQNIEVTRLLLQERPETPIDEPVRQDHLTYYGPSESAISVAVAWDFPHIVDMLVDHARQHESLAIGQGLVEAARKKNPALLRSILRGFVDGDCTANDHYDALVQVAKEAARNREMSLMQLLLDYAVVESTRERLLSEFLREGIVKADWYTVLPDIKEAFAPPFFDRLPPKALLAVSAKGPDDFDSESVDFDEEQENVDGDRPAFVDAFQSLCEKYHMCVSAYSEALIEAAKSNNVEILRFLLRGQHAGYHTWSDDDKAHWIDRTDSHGNTALYYACVGGHAKTFFSLVESGADIYTNHIPYSSCLVPEMGERFEQKGGNRANLLEITLDARGFTLVHYDWSGGLEKSWGPIVLYLLDASLEIDLESTSLVKSFYIACYHGHLAYVAALLERGISLVGQADGNDSGYYSFGSALQAAAVGGQKAVVELLLNHGANVQFKADFRYDGETKSQTAVKTAIEGPWWISGPESAVLETCAYLVESGASDSDAEVVLRRACEKMEMEIVKRMLRHGAKVQTVPFKPRNDMANIDLYHTFVECGYDLRSQTGFIARLQVHAIARGEISFLENLLGCYGPQPGSFVSADFVLAIRACKGDRVSVLRYLIRRLSFNIDAVCRFYPESGGHGNLLCQAAVAHNVEDVEWLLKEGADPNYTGLPNTPLTAALKDVASSCCSNPGSPLQVVKTLLEHGADVHGSRGKDREPDGRLKRQFHKTPLMFAVRWDSRDAPKVVKLLIEHGADVNHGVVSPFRLASYLGRPDIERLLLQHGARDDGDPRYSVDRYAHDLRSDRGIY